MDNPFTRVWLSAGKLSYLIWCVDAIGKNLHPVCFYLPTVNVRIACKDLKTSAVSKLRSFVTVPLVDFLPFCKGLSECARTRGALQLVRALLCKGGSLAHCGSAAQKKLVQLKL